jgi:hypothetical protein
VLRKESLLPSDKLNQVSLPVTESNQVLVELEGACSWVLSVAGNIVLTTNLVFYNLIRCFSGPSVGGEEPLLLVENIRGSRERV